MAQSLTERAAQSVEQRNQQTAERPSLQALIGQQWVADEVQKQLGPKRDAGVFLRSVVNQIKAAPDLNKCDPATVFGGMFTAAQLDLEIGTALGQCFLIPRQTWSKRENDFGGMEASFQIGYKGLLALTYRTGMITGAASELVMVGDKFKRGSNSERGPFYDLDYGPEHDNPDAQIMGVLGMFWVRGTERPTWRYLTLDQVEERRPQHTKEQTGRNGTYVPNTPWKSNYREMVEKTGLINGLRFAPRSAHLALAMAVDETTLSATREAPREITASGENGTTAQIELEDQASAQ